MLGNTDMQAVADIKAIITKDDPSLQPEKKEQPEKAQVKAPVEAEPVNEPEELDQESGADDGDDLDLDDDSSPADPETRAPSVTPPAGLTADETELFRNSPPEVQKAWARREQDRTKELRRLQNEQAEYRKTVDAEKAALAAERQQLAQERSQYGNRLVQEFQEKFKDVTDPIKLATEDPVRFTEFQAHLLRIQHAENMQRQEQAKAEQEFNAKLQAFRTEQNDILREKLNLKTDDAWNKFDSDITEYLTNKGIPRERLVRADAGELEMAWKAMKYDQAIAKRKSVEKTARPPEYMKPGSKSNLSPQEESRSASMKRLKKSGSIHDAAAVLKGML